jgi:hypothetical protein
MCFLGYKFHKQIKLERAHRLPPALELGPGQVHTNRFAGIV